MTKDNKQQLEEKINRAEKAYKIRKRSFKVQKWIMGAFVAFCIILFFKERNILYLAIACFVFSITIYRSLILKQERTLVDNIYEWLTNIAVMERKDTTIHNLIEIFFTLKEDIRNNILNRDEIYDRIIGITNLINTGDIIKEDYAKPVVDRKP